MFLFVPLLNLLFLCWQYITWARQKVIINISIVEWFIFFPLFNALFLLVVLFFFFNAESGFVSSLSLFFIGVFLYFVLVLACFALACFAFGGFFNTRFCGFVSSLSLFYSFFFYAFNPIVLQVVMKVYLSFWIVLFNITVSYLFLFSHYSFTFTIDYYIIEVVNIRLNCLSWWMVNVVILVSSCVILCSIDYLAVIDSFLFVSLLFLFEFFMISFVISYNFIIVFFSWDWLGLISYLLINFWSSKTRSGIKAVVYNKIGDIGLIIVLCLAYSYMPFINYSPFLPYLLILLVYLMLSAHSFALLYLVFFLILALFTKSSQLPWSSWLIWAMAAPTPTSALLHSSTMVIAGVYLGLIMQPLFNLVFNYFSLIYLLFLFIPLGSMVWSVFKAIFLSDIKSIIAFSTISQISYMFIAMFCSVPLVCFFHIIIHALFKSLLFLISGSFIHAQSSFQSIYKLKVFHSFINWIFILAGSVLIISLSKEGIIYSTTFIIASSFFAMVVVLGGIFTMVYTMKIYSLVFSGIFINSYSILSAFNYVRCLFGAHINQQRSLFSFYSFSFLLPWLTISSIFIDQSLHYIFRASCSLIYYSIDSSMVLSMNCIMDYSLVSVVFILSVLLSIFYGLLVFKTVFFSYAFFNSFFSLTCKVKWSYWYSFSSFVCFYFKSIIKLHYAMLCYTYLFLCFIFTSYSSYFVLSFDYLFFIYSTFFFKYLIYLIEVYTGLSSFYSMLISSLYLIVYLLLLCFLLIFSFNLNLIQYLVARQIKRSTLF